MFRCDGLEVIMGDIQKVAMTFDFTIESSKADEFVELEVEVAVLFCDLLFEMIEALVEVVGW